MVDRGGGVLTVRVKERGYKGGGGLYGMGGEKRFIRDGAREKVYKGWGREKVYKGWRERKGL